MLKTCSNRKILGKSSADFQACKRQSDTKFFKHKRRFSAYYCGKGMDYFWGIVHILFTTIIKQIKMKGRDGFYATRQRKCIKQNILPYPGRS